MAPEASPDTHFFITFNGKRFDVPFVCARAYLLKLSVDVRARMHAYDHFDLQYLTKKFLSLDETASLLGCTPKSGSGMEAVRLLYEGKFEELMAYCAQDVNTTEEVYLKWKGLQGESAVTKIRPTNFITEAKSESDNTRG